MNRQKPANKILAAALALVCMAGLGCEPMAKDEVEPLLTLKVEFPDRAAAAVPSDEPGAKDVPGPNAVIVTPPPPPGATVYHVKIVITNPREVEIIYNYVPGTPVNMLAQSGYGRQISAEAWEVDPSAPGPGQLGASHFVTTTPAADRTVDLIGEPVSVTVTVGRDPGTGAVNDWAPYNALIDGAPAALPLSSSCPAEAGYQAMVADLDFPLAFPAIPVTLFSGGVPQPFSISGLAQGHNYQVTVWHAEAGIVSESYLFLGGPTGNVDLFFQGHVSPQIAFNPAALAGLTPITSQSVSFSLVGGWGGLSGPSVGGRDTCGGAIAGNDYVFTVPYFGDSCVIHVQGTDCSGASAQGVLVAGIDLSQLPACIDFDGDGAVTTAWCGGPIDCDDGDPNNWASCGSCVDTDGDGWRVGCDAYVTVNGPDCDAADGDHWADCGTCSDADGDDHGVGCDPGPDCDEDPLTGPACNAGCPTFYRDFDLDLRGDAGVMLSACSTPAGYVSDSSDCNDADPNHWSDCGSCVDADGDDYGALCDLGPDCDDDPLSGPSCNAGCLTFYRDFDGDGYGAAGVTQGACVAPAGYVVDNTDCDDASAAHWSDCGSCLDGDGDGYGALCDQGADCDDDPGTGPSCNAGCPTFYFVSDGDSYGDATTTAVACVAPGGYVADNADCDDASAAHWSDCLTCVDSDGDDYGAGCDYNFDCDDGDPNNYMSCITCADFDMDTYWDMCDQYVTINGPDCNDNLANAWVSCGTCGPDDDMDDWGLGSCDGPPDCDDHPVTGGACNTGCSTYYHDFDGDNRGDPGDPRDACSQPAGFLVDSSDCDDNNINAWSTCNTCVDSDGDSFYDLCNTYLAINGPDCDDGNPNCDFDCTDGDGDNYCLSTDCDDGNENAWNTCATCTDFDLDTYFELCNQYVGINGPDCDDAIYNVWTSCGTCNVDADFDGVGIGVCDAPADCDDDPFTGVMCYDSCLVFYQDSDLDLFGNSGAPANRCMAPMGYVIDNTDCDDANLDVFPNAMELCDGVDNQCPGDPDPGTGMADEGCPPWYVDAVGGDDLLGWGHQSSPWQTIQHAVDMSLPGDVVNVAEGIYAENVLVTSDLSLYGGHDPATWTREPTVFRSVIDGAAGPGVVIDVSNVSVDGFFVVNGDPGVLNYGGIATISHNVIQFNSIGVFSYSYYDAVAFTGLNAFAYLSNNLINYNAYLGVYASNYDPSCANVSYGKVVSTNDTIISPGLGGDVYVADQCMASPMSFASIRNSIIGVYVFSDWGVTNLSTIDYSCYAGVPIINGANNVQLLAPGYSYVVGYPAYPNYMHMPISTHPCRDRGDPAPAFNDPDGSRNDAGFTGGGTATWFDRDYDGMPDAWETYFGLDMNSPADALLDPDLDLSPNLVEFYNGTDPLVP